MAGADRAAVAAGRASRAVVDVDAVVVDTCADRAVAGLGKRDGTALLTGRGKADGAAGVLRTMGEGPTDDEAVEETLMSPAERVEARRLPFDPTLRGATPLTMPAAVVGPSRLERPVTGATDGCSLRTILGAFRALD